MTEELGRKRAMRAEVRITRQALKVALPINRQIGSWQASAVRLLAMAQRLAASGRYNPSIVEEAETLATLVASQSEALKREMNALPTEISGSTRLLDTARALKSIGDGLDRALKLMPRGRPNETRAFTGSDNRDNRPPMALS
jgi:hypothetical protein